MADIKLTEKSAEVFNYVKENGGKVSISDLAKGVGRTERSVGANVTDLKKKGLMVREYEGEGDDKVTYAILTDEGAEYTAPAIDEE